MDRFRELRNRLANSKTIGEMDEIRAELDGMATQAAKNGDLPLCTKLEDAANGIRRVIYAKIGKERGLSNAQIEEMQQKHEAAIHAGNMMNATAKHLENADSSEIELFNERMKRFLFGSGNPRDLSDALEMGVKGSHDAGASKAPNTSKTGISATATDSNGTPNQKSGSRGFKALAQAFFSRYR